ncbi:catechol 1,2-dioxygenase [Acrasis kona]|uniref:Catechol 1,2-dioxygenase n=1 Tax=Acrasis kona TaxID=1008807 RepID=A0AAW2YYN0_9EUKA
MKYTLVFSLTFILQACYVLSACTLHPEVTEGPYYVAGMPVRGDITEDKTGLPLILNLRVVDSTTCSAYAGNATVEIWHCDAAGVYSHYEAASKNQGTATDTKTYLRGIQYTNSSAYVTFNTIFPGWYTSRDTHIHLKVHINGKNVHTGQLFFNDTLEASIAKIAPYSSNTNQVTLQSNDNVYKSGGSYGMLYPSYISSTISSGLTASLDLVVNPSSTSSSGSSPVTNASYRPSSNAFHTIFIMIVLAFLLM